MTAHRAVCTIIAGPNGSGKSSLYDRAEPVGEFVNADLIARDASVGTIEAGRRAIARLNSLLIERCDFVFETTLSSRQSLSVMGMAKRHGYEINLLFVILSSVTLHLRRVEGRVRMGGHNIPKRDIERRYTKSMQNLALAIPLADTCTILDNSRAAPEVLLHIRDGRIEANALAGHRAHHVALAHVVAEALAKSADDVFGAARHG